MTENGVFESMSALRLGDRVAALDADGAPTFAPIIAFLDRISNEERLFYSISTSKGGVGIELSPYHLIYAAPNNGTDIQTLSPIFARDVRIGNYVYVVAAASSVAATDVAKAKPERVTEVATILKKGAYAPLTTTGTIVVNGVVASCYAVEKSHLAAHAAFGPIRAYHAMVAWFAVDEGGDRARVVSRDGIHWYANFLKNVVDFVSPRYLR